MHSKHIPGVHALGGGNVCLYKDFSGGKASSFYVNLKINDSVGGKSWSFLHLEALPPVPPVGTYLVQRFSGIRLVDSE